MVWGWVLNHLPLLGTTGKTIVFTGDSAGGSLVTGLTLRCLQLNIRPPDGLFLAYTPFMLKMIPSPAKLLSVMDPMLPLSFALRCLKSYAGYTEEETMENSGQVITIENIIKMSDKEDKLDECEEAKPSTIENLHDTGDNVVVDKCNLLLSPSGFSDGSDSSFKTVSLGSVSKATDQPDELNKNSDVSSDPKFDSSSVDDGIMPEHLGEEVCVLLEILCIIVIIFFCPLKRKLIGPHNVC